MLYSDILVLLVTFDLNTNVKTKQLQVTGTHSFALTYRFLGFREKINSINFHPAASGGLQNAPLTPFTPTDRAQGLKRVANATALLEPRQMTPFPIS